MRWIFGTTLSLLAVVACLAFYVAPPGETRPAMTDWFLVGLTVILGGVGSIQAFIYWKQKDVMEQALNATRDSNRAARDSAEAADKATKATLTLERSWVFANSVGVPIVKVPLKHRDDVSTLGVTFVMVNHGRSPAVVLSTQLDLVVVEPPYPDNLDLPDPVRGSGSQRFPIPPGGFPSAQFAVDSKPLTRVFQEHILDCSAHLLMYGVVNYTDVLNEPRRLGFAWAFKRSGAPRPLQGRDRVNEWNNSKADDWYMLPGPDAYWFSE